MLYEGRRESLIAKKLQESRDFCFWNGWIAAAEQISRKTGDGADLSNDVWGGASAATEADLGKGAGVAMVAGQIP